MEEEKNKIEKEYTEPVDTDVAKCPYCQSYKINFLFTKRGISFKCQNCQMDSHYWQDVGVGGQKHRQRELEALPYLKAITPDLNFIENTDYGWEFLTEPEQPENDHKIYDAKIYFGGYKLERIKIAIAQNITLERYMTSDENYLQGRQDVVNKLAKIGALYVWFFPQDNNKIAIAYCDELMKYVQETKDRFGNRQFTIPKEVRKVLMITDEERIKEIFHRKLFSKIKEKRYIL